MRPRSETPRPSRRAAARLALSLGLLFPACVEAGGGAGGSAEGGGLVIQNATDARRPYFHDFGTLEEGDQVRHVYELLNADPDPVTIRRISPACVCTLGRVWTTDEGGQRIDGKVRGEPVLVVPPGRTAFVEVALDTNHVSTRNVDKLALVHLLCDSPNTPRISFELHTFVRVPLQATPREVDLKDVPQSAGGVATTTVIAAVRESGVRVLGVGQASEELEVTVDAVEQFGEPVWLVTAHLAPGLPVGPWSGSFELRPSGDGGEGEGRPFRVPVRARVVEDVVLRPAPLAFSTFDPEDGAWARAVLTALVPGDRVRIVDWSATGEQADALDVRVEPVDPDDGGRSPEWRVTMLAPPALDGKSFVGTLRLELDHETVPEIQAQYVCRPRR